MKIATFNVELQSSRQFTQSFETKERLEVWHDKAAPQETGHGKVQISDAARLAQQANVSAGQSQATAATSQNDAIDNDPRLSMLIRMIEYLTGKPVHHFSMSDPQAAPDVGATQPNTNAAASGAPRAGFGMEYTASATYSESESTSFSASGVVHTTDGAAVSFELGFTMSRSYSESTSVNVQIGDRRLQDPLVLDFSGTAAALSDAHFEFDLNSDGSKESLPLLSGSGFLALDQNNNGRIDNGSELFGPTSGNGFAELAALDNDGNGWIDEADAAWSKLRVWQPDAEGGGQLQTLQQAGVGAFYLGTAATPFSINNAANETQGQMQASSIYLREDGSAGTLSQVDLAV